MEVMQIVAREHTIGLDRMAKRQDRIVARALDVAEATPKRVGEMQWISTLRMKPRGMRGWAHGSGEIWWAGPVFDQPAPEA